MGQFGNETVSLTLTNLPPHAEVSVSFDLFVIQSWDGNDGPDVWDLSVADGPTLLHTTFSNVESPQAYPDMYPGGDHPPRTGASEINTLGYNPDLFGDAVYQLSFTFPHSASALVLNFAGIGLQEIEDESWGIDNVRVTIRTPLVPLAAQVTLNVGPDANDDTFTISQATFILGDGSDGIAPPTDAVTLQIGTFSLTIPSGSFHPTSAGAFAFAGVIDGVTLQVTLTPLSRATFALEASGAGATLTGIVVLVPVELTIGDDGGNTMLPVAELSAHSLPPQRE